MWRTAPLALGANLFAHIGVRYRNELEIGNRMKANVVAADDGHVGPQESSVTSGT